MRAVLLPCCDAPEGDAHRSADADGRCAAHNHGGDDVGDILVVFASTVGLFQGETRLVEKPNAFPRSIRGWGS